MAPKTQTLTCRVCARTWTRVPKRGQVPQYCHRDCSDLAARLAQLVGLTRRIPFATREAQSVWYRDVFSAAQALNPTRWTEGQAADRLADREDRAEAAC